MSQRASTHKHLRRSVSPRGRLQRLGWLVRLGPFLNDELWVGADNMRVQRCRSHVRRRVAWVRAWLENVCVVRCLLRGGASEVSSTLVVIYGGVELEKAYKEGTHHRFGHPPIAEGPS